jgi:hypothetical protein
MKNAHDRFGFAEFEKSLRDTTTRIRLTADSYIGESQINTSVCQAHLLSIFGADAEVAALWAAVLSDEPICMGGPTMRPHMVRFGDRPSVYRATFTVAGHRRPIRHLIVLSRQLRGDTDQSRIIVKDGAPGLVLRAAANFHGLPLLSTWDQWFVERLRKAGRLRPLTGLNCAPVAIRGTKAEFLEWIGSGLRLGQIRIPSP